MTGQYIRLGPSIYENAPGLYGEKQNPRACTRMTSKTENEVATSVRQVHLSYNPAESHTSALRLILTLFPDWERAEGKVEFVRFTDGITNTVSIPNPAKIQKWAVPITPTEALFHSF